MKIIFSNNYFIFESTGRFDKEITRFGERSDFAINLPPGDNKIHFRVTNASGPAGLLVEARNGTQVLFVSDNSWTW